MLDLKTEEFVCPHCGLRAPMLDFEEESIPMSGAECGHPIMEAYIFALGYARAIKAAADKISTLYGKDWDCECGSAVQGYSLVIGACSRRVSDMVEGLEKSLKDRGITEITLKWEPTGGDQ